MARLRSGPPASAGLFRLVLLVAIIASTLVAQSQPESRKAESAPVPPTIKGRVVDAKGAPIAGVTVKLVPFVAVGERMIPSRTVVTDQNGAFAFLSETEGWRFLSISHPAFLWYGSAEFEVAKTGDVIRPDIVLTQSATIRGIVRLPDGKPDRKARVQVSLRDSKSQVIERRTARDGRFELSGLAEGEYSIVVTERNGQPDLATSRNKPNVITLAAGEVKEIDL